MFPTKHDLIYFFAGFWKHSTGLVWIIALMFAYALVSGLQGRKLRATLLLGVSGMMAVLLGLVEAFL